MLSHVLCSLQAAYYVEVDNAEQHITIEVDHMRRRLVVVLALQLGHQFLGVKS